MSLSAEHPVRVGDTGVQIKLKAVGWNPDTQALEAFDIVTGSPTLKIIIYRDSQTETEISTNISASFSSPDYFATWNQDPADATIFTVIGNYEAQLEVTWSDGKVRRGSPLKIPVRR